MEGLSKINETDTPIIVALIFLLWWEAINKRRNKLYNVGNGIRKKAWQIEVDYQRTVPWMWDEFYIN